MIVGLEQVSILLAQVNDLFQVGLEDGKIGLALGLDPGLMAHGGGLDVFHQQGQGDLGLLLDGALGDLDHAGLIGLGLQVTDFFHQVVDQLGDLIGGDLFMHDAPQGRHLHPTFFCPAGRHVDLLVPAQHGLDMAEVGQFGRQVDQLL